MQNENGKRPIEPYELLLGLAKEAKVVANRAEAVAQRNVELAREVVKAAKDTSALAREARFNAVQAMDRAKKVAPEGFKLDEEPLDPADEEAIMKAENAAVDEESEQPVEDEESGLSGWPDDGSNPANAEFEALLQARVLKFVSGTYEATGQKEQCIVPGPNGRRNDIFENKDLFKRCTPKFFFNGESKQWRRVAPEGWMAA
jgi:hypothetical protein